MPIYVDCTYGHMIDIDYSWPERSSQESIIDVNAFINIRVYTQWIADRPNPASDAAKIAAILEIRGWFWERHLLEASSAECSKQRAYHKSLTGKDMRKLVNGFVKPITESLGLGVSED